MQIFTIPFEEHFYIQINGKTVKLITFPTSEPGNIKFGIDAAREIQIHREEIYESIQEQKKATNNSQNTITEPLS